MPDPFDIPLVPGLALAEEFMSSDEERALVAASDGVALSPFRFQGWEGKRLTASFGWHYDFDRDRVAPTTPMPDFLLEVRARAASFAGLDPAALVLVLALPVIAVDRN